MRVTQTASIITHNKYMIAVSKHRAVTISFTVFFTASNLLFGIACYEDGESQL